MYKGDQLFQVLLKYDFDLNRNGHDVPTYLEEHFEKYLREIESASSGTNPFLGVEFCKQVLENVPLIKDISNRIVEIGQINRNGKIKDAFENAFALFSSMEPYFLFRFSGASRDGDFYRIRRGDLRIKPGEDSKKKKSELFHIKDSKRNLIGAYRFSIPGFPCLYLTSGFELGWFESGMPEKFSYCRMHIEESGENALQLIDISNRPIDLLSNIHVWILNAKEKTEELQKIHKYLLNYIITYPLAAACSIKVKDRGEKFVEEYVIPQMLMNWIRETSKFDGIRYKSSLNTTLVQGMGDINIGLPVKKFRDDGLCENLTAKITVSDIGYMDVNEEFNKYHKFLQDLMEFKNNLRNKRIRERYCGGYVLRLIELCEAVSVSYNSIICGNQLNDVLLHQMDCLADYIYTIYDMKESIVQRSINEVKEYEPSVDEAKLQADILSDIDEFYKLITKIVHKHAVFHFSTEDLSNYENI